MYSTTTDGITTSALTNTVGGTLTWDIAQTGTVQTVGTIGIGTILLLFIIAHLLDRRLNHPNGSESTVEEEAPEA